MRINTLFCIGELNWIAALIRMIPRSRIGKIHEFNSLN